MENTRYIAQADDARRAAPGQYITPAPRSYLTPAHAQLANPQGRVYVATLNEAEDRLEIEAQLDCYPLDLLETKVPGFGAQAEGAEVLRDLGPGKPHRWSVHFRNDQLGGYHGGSYFDTWDEAVQGYAERAASTFARTATMAARAAPRQTEEA